MIRKDFLTQTRGNRNPAKKEEGIHPFIAFQDEMNRLIDNFFHGSSLSFFEKKSGVFVPDIDVTDTGKEIKVYVELPGMEEKDLEVSLTKDSLTIKGEKKEEKEEKSGNYHRMERSYGSFARTIPLPGDIETEKVEAIFKRGVLCISLPKTEKTIKETKKIAIKAE